MFLNAISLHEIILWQKYSPSKRYNLHSATYITMRTVRRQNKKKTYRKRYRYRKKADHHQFPLSWNLKLYWWLLLSGSKCMHIQWQGEGLFTTHSQSRDCIVESQQWVRYFCQVVWCNTHSTQEDILQLDKLKLPDFCCYFHGFKLFYKYKKKKNEIRDKHL